jgi:hypothetical protein
LLSLSSFRKKFERLSAARSAPASLSPASPVYDRVNTAGSAGAEGVHQVIFLCA